MSVPRILHYPGSKWSMAEWIISSFPSHYQDMTYLSLFFGSGAELFRKEPSRLETVNDIDGDVVNLFRIIRDRPDELANKLFWTPHSREEYYASYEPVEDELERARRFMVRTWQAIGGKTSDRTGWKSVIQYDKAPHKASNKQWNELYEKVMMVTERLKDVQIENQPALQILERYKHADVLIYADPPYILSTRSKRMYKHEMSDDDHIELLEALDDHPGPVILSGYSNQLYDDRLVHWRRETKIVQAEAGRERTEVLWINPIAAEHAGRQLTLW